MDTGKLAVILFPACFDTTREQPGLHFNAKRFMSLASSHTIYCRVLDCLLPAAMMRRCKKTKCHGTRGKGDWWELNCCAVSQNQGEGMTATFVVCIYGMKQTSILIKESVSVCVRVCVCSAFKLPLFGGLFTTPPVWLVLPYALFDVQRASLTGAVQCSESQCQHHRTCSACTVHLLVVRITRSRTQVTGTGGNQFSQRQIPQQ